MISDQSSVISEAISAFVAEVRTWIGTPFVHAGRARGVGVDCVGILAGSAQAVGLAIEDQANYSPLVDSAYLVSQLLKYCRLVPLHDRRAGDILLFSVQGNAQHTGVMVSDRTFVHAYQTAGRVCESDLEPVFARTLTAVFRIREGLWPR